MKNLNLIKRLWTDSHEKQSPQRFGRYAAMLIMLLTLGVGQMWAAWYVQGTGSGLNGWGGGAQMTQSNSNTNVYYRQVSGSCEFKITSNSSGYNDQRNGSHINNTLGSFNLSGSSGSNISGDGGDNWYICYNTSSEKVYGTTVIPYYPDLYLGGDDSWISKAWNTTDNANKLSRSSSIYTIAINSVSASVDHKMKIAAYGWGQPQYGSTAYNLSGSKNINSKSADGDGNKVFQTYVTGQVIVKLDISAGTFTLYGPRTITLNNQSATSAGTESVAATYGADTSNITCPTKTGYNFGGYYTGTGGSGKNVIKAGGSWVATVSNYTSSGKYAATANKTLYAKWTQTVTLHDNNGGSHNGSATATYNSTGAFTPTAPTKTGYHVEGYYAEPACTNKVMTDAGALVNYSGYVESGKWVHSGATTLYAKWVGNTYYVSYNANGGSGTMTNSTHTYGTASNLKTCTFTAPSGKTFAGWATSSGGSVEYADGASVSTLTATDGGTYPLFAKWDDLSGGSVTLNAGTGGKVSKDNSNWGASATITDITSDQAVNIYAQANTGYTFSTWTKTSGSGSVKTNAASGAYNAIGYANDVVTASFTENMSALSVSRTIDEGSPSIAVPTVAGSATDVGYVTTRTITAAAAATGYALTSWTITNGTRTDGGGDRANPITVRSNGDGLAVTVTANYSIQSYTISASNSNVTYSPASGTSFKFGSTGDKMTITPKSGYKITAINTGNVALTASADNNAAGSWTVTGTMPGTDVTLTVTTAAVPEIRLLGRFKIYNSTRTVYTTVNGSNDDWEEDYSDSHLSMTYNYVTGYYDLATYRSASELTADDAPYFFLKSSSTKYGTSSGGNTDLGSSVPVSANVYSSGGGGNFHFNSDAALINVVLHFDKENYKFWFTGEAETLYSTTFYAGDHGSINAKGTSISKNSSKSVTIGLGKALTATPESGYLFDYWETTGSVTVADIYSASTTVTATAAGGTVRAHYSAVVNSGWYVHGQIDDYGQWGPDKKERPIDRSYRGVSGVYYRRISKLNNDAYFGVHDGTNKYSGHTKTDVDYNVSSLNTLITLYTNSEKSFQAKADFAGKWLVVNTNGTKKMWIQDTDAYYTMSVTSDHGTVTLTENVYGNLQTNQFEAGETVNISVSAASGYWIDDIELNGTPLVTDRNSGSWSGSTTMPAGNATLTVTYNRYYTLTYDANYYTSGTGGTAPSASSYVSGSNVTVVGKGDLTMTNYTFSGWNTDPHITGTNYAEGANIEMTGNITLYGVWKRTIPFELEDADPEFVMATVYGTYNCTTLTDYDNPTKDGYTFGGWWTNIAGGDNYVISPEKELQPGVYHWTNYDNKTNEFMRYPTSKSSLYAKWTQTVTLNPNLANHGSGDNTSATIVYKATGKTSITHCTPAAGYHLVGYYTAATDGVKVLNADGSFAAATVTDYITDSKWTKAGATTLFAHYEPNTYDVILDVNGATTGSNQTVTATYDANMPTTQKGGSTPISAPSKTGYTFGGYWTNAAGTGTQYYTSGLASNHVWDVATNNTTIYAKWTANPYTVVLDKQTGVTGYGGNAGTVANQTVTFDATPATVSGTMPSAADGYAFMGFYSATGGNGRCFIDPSGNWVTSAGDTISGGNWVKPAGITLYAYYKQAEITEVTLSTGSTVAPSTTGITATATLAPASAGTTHIDWRILYSNDNPLAIQPSFGTGTTTNSFTAPETSGTYKLEATLRTGSTANSGTLLDSYVLAFQVAGDHTVTVQYKCGDVTLQGAKSISARPLVWSDEIIPDEIFGYSFEKWVAGDGVTMTMDDGVTTIETGGETTGKATTHAVRIKAIYDGKLIAKYTKKNIIYFKNTLGWSEVYVNLYPYAWWNSSKGAGNNTLADDNRNKQMTQLGETDIWYYEYGNTATTAYVSFTDRTQNNYEGFAGTSGSDKVQVSYPTRPDATKAENANYGFNAGTPMFVPTAGQTAQPWNKSGSDDLAEYYNKGYWRKYDPIQGETGYTLKVYNKTEDSGRTELKSIKFVESDVPGQLFKAVADLEAAGGYGIKFERDNSMLYTNAVGHLQHTGDVVITDKQDDNYAAIWIKATAAGDYTFAITINGDGKLCIQAEFPVAENDYRVIYTDNDTWTKAHTACTWVHPSRIISAEENAVDTISFFVSKGHSPEFKIQRVNSIDEETGAITWTDVTSWTSCNDVDASGVYNFIFTQDGSKNISFTKKEPYTGNFYIRTDAAGSTKWDNYRAADHLMTYSEYSETYSDFTHYFVAHVESTNNVKFVVANDYSPCISDTLEISTYRGGDAAHINSGGYIKANANVRFMWDRRKNAVYRAYLDEAKSDGSRFLVLRANSSDDLMDENGNPLTSSNNHGAPDNSIQFVDNENWIYETNVMVKPGAYVKLYGHFNSQDFYFKGESGDDFNDEDGDGDGIANAIQLMTGDGEAQKVRVIYDFKTDRLLAAWMPSGEIDGEHKINADVMFVREGQGDINQLVFVDRDLDDRYGSITAIKSAYGVMRFNKWTLNNKEKTGSHGVLSSPASIYERSLFWISFPFRVKLSDVFGFGTYGVDWAIQRYDGAERAEKGFWAESSGFWKWMDRNTEYLEPDQGYLLAIDLDLLGESASVWNNGVEQIELYFPSYGTMPGITSAAVEHTLPSHACEIDWSGRSNGNGGTLGSAYNRTIKDSHWNVMSVPTYVNTSNIAFANTTWTNTIGPNFLYTWNASDNTLTPTAGEGYHYHAMHAYMVQYHGDVTWTASSGSPYPIVARRTYAEQPKKVNFCLEIQQNEKMLDRTFVQMSDDEEVSAEFSFGEDMGKEFNSRKANIYTVIEGYLQAAGNTLPMSDQTTLVPVGVKTTAAGEYTFAMPDGTNGVSVVLIDNIAGTRTNLALSDYTVALGKGDLSDRFMLEIAPIKQMPTDVENVPSDDVQSTNVRKVMVDGILYIVKDGKVFDARGAKVK